MLKWQFAVSFFLCNNLDVKGGISMFTKILTDNEAQKFSELTGIRSTKVLISKGKRYYYATIVNQSVKIRISKELASIFI